MSSDNYKDAQLSVRVPVELADEIERRAKAERRSKSDYLRLVIEAHLASSEVRDANPVVRRDLSKPFRSDVTPRFK